MSESLLHFAVLTQHKVRRSEQSFDHSNIRWLQSSGMLARHSIRARAAPDEVPRASEHGCAISLRDWLEYLPGCLD